MKCELYEICGDWALKVFDGNQVTIYFNSRQNALNVKRILEADASIPNAATVCDMTEVVRCKDCKYLMFSDFYGQCVRGYRGIVQPWDYCSFGERKKPISTSCKD